jgi:hypothetical protein
MTMDNVQKQNIIVGLMNNELERIWKEAVMA